MIDRKALAQKWAPVLEHADLPKISDAYRREVTAVLLENQQREMTKSSQLNEDAPANSVGGFPDSGGVAKFDPVLISLVRRSMPKLIAYDVAGVQPLTQPTGLIFAMKSKYAAQNGAEALFNESNTEFAGKDGAGDQAAYDFADAATNVIGRGMSTAEGEALGTGGANPNFNQMAFSIEKIAVEAKTRKLKAEYSLELAQDMKAVHGIDAEAELSNILSTEILSEINREIIRTIYQTANRGAVAGTTATAGTFDLDVDANGRWSVEKFKGLMFQIEREANAIGQQTRRGRGNFIICSADVASALQMAGVLDYTPALAANANLTVDDTSTTFAGILNGKYKVYIDPYTGNGGANPQYFVMGYKGSSSTDAGLFYAPYVPLQMMRAVDPNSFQPKIAFQTRYGIVANPFSQGANAVTGALTADSNVYYRKVRVLNIL
ncbi:MAG: ATP-binding protein [Desulfuromonadaceae bacterium]